MHLSMDSQRTHTVLSLWVWAWVSSLSFTLPVSTKILETELRRLQSHGKPDWKYPTSWKAIKKHGFLSYICTLMGSKYKVSRWDFAQHMSEYLQVPSPVFLQKDSCVRRKKVTQRYRKLISARFLRCCCNIINYAIYKALSAELINTSRCYQLNAQHTELLIECMSSYDAS